VPNSVAAWLVLAVVALFAADHFWLGWNLPVQAGKVLAVWIDWLAFWR
jgi:hypothetical protein